MRKLTIYLLFFIAFVGIMSSCKKDDTTTPTKTKTEMLSKTWQVNTASFKSSLGINIDYTKGGTNTLIDLTQLRITFKSDGTWAGYDNGGKPANGTWALTNSDTKIYINATTGNFLGLNTITADVVTLSDTNLDITFNGTLPTYGTVTATVKFIPA